MNRDTIFTVTNEDLGRLNPTEAVLFIRDMLWAEARRLGPGTCKINVPSEINASDGGIDATVDAGSLVTHSDIIAPGKNGYQIKSGKTFKPWLQKTIKKEFFGDRRPLNRENLGENIRACLENDGNDDGTYVLVCTGINLSKSQTEKARAYIEKYLKQKCEFENPKVKVWSQDDLINFLQEFPLLELILKRLHEAKFQTHWIWSRAPDMQVPFVYGQLQDELIEKIQNELRRSDYPVHVRVWGEPGIGKTRLVLESTKTDDLSPLVIYYRSASQFESSALMSEIHFNDNLSAIVVIDECDTASQARIWYQLRPYSPRIKLITIYNDYEEQAEGITYHFTEPLTHEQIRDIIVREYGIPEAQADRWAALCDGSPRVAHVIGWNLVNHPEDVLKPPGTVDIWERYIAAGDANLERTEERRSVLQHLALFKRFIYEQSVEEEIEAIANKIEAANPQIKRDKFETIIHQLRERRILQGEPTLYITPKALHIKLWSQWWESRIPLFNLERFTQGLTPRLVEWFYEMFQYAAESDAATEIVTALLRPDGPFRDDENLKTRLGSRFFFALTKAHPESALSCLMRTMGTWDRETLLNVTSGRRYIVEALRKIAMQRELFADAARLLLALGEAENEGCSNNASGVFADLFPPTPGRMARTEASPAERLPILKEAFESGSKERRALALKTCDAALQSQNFLRMRSVEHQRGHPEPEPWVPHTYSELWDAYRQVWQLLSEQLERMSEDECKEGVEVLLERARGIARISELADMVVDTMATIAKKTYASEKQLIETISRILHHDSKDLPVETRQRWEQLNDELVGSDFHSLLQRYVGMNLLEDEYDADGNYVAQAQSQIEALAQQAVENHHLLQSELHWLVTIEAKKGYHFGYELGKRDDGFSLLSTLLDTQRNAGENASVSFLGGYFRSIFEKDVPLWEQQLDALVDDATLNIAIPELTHRSGLTDRAGWRVLNLATSGIINRNHFGIFVYSKTIEGLSDQVFTKWIEFLMNTTDKSVVSIALHLYHDYYIRRKPEPTLPPDLTFRLLAHPALFEESDQYRFNTMTDYYWTEIGKVFLNCYPKKRLEFVEPMLSHFGERGVIVGVDSKTCSVLNEITKQHPTEVWKQVIKLLEDQTRSARVVALERWLRGGDLSDFAPMEDEDKKGTLTLILPQKIWEWIDEAVEERAWYFASKLVPKTLSAGEWPTSLAREFLARYGEREEVRGCLRSNYLIEGWSGPTSLHYQEKQQKLLHIKDGEDNENVKRWIDEFVEGLEQEIERARMDEERRF